jgi:molybdenum cofactor cytidylyltransferase
MQPSPDSFAKGIAALILAAGQAERMGQAKVLLEWTEGKTILEHIVEQVHAVVDDVTVITGAYHVDVAIAAQRANVVTLHNSDFAGGEMLSSLKIGLQYLMADAEIEAVLVVLGDQPQIEVSTIHAVLEAYRAGSGTIVAPRFEGQRGHPVLFGRVHWQAICDLPAGAAPRMLFAAQPESVYHVEVSSDSVVRDIDTPADYAAERKRAGLSPS